MAMEIIVAAIAGAFIVLVIFAVIALQNVSKTLKRADRTLAEAHKAIEALSKPGEELLHNTNKLIVDLKKKSEAIDVFFRPLYGVKRERHEAKNRFEKVSEVMEFVAEGVRLFSIVKDEFK